MSSHKPSSIEMWKLEVSKWTESGLSQREYCRRVNIPVSTFHGWCSKLKKYNSNISAISSSDFLNVKLARTPFTHDIKPDIQAGIALSIGSDVKILLSKGFDKNDLQKTVSAILEVI